MLNSSPGIYLTLDEVQALVVEPKNPIIMPTLSIRKTNAFEESYSDRGTGSKKDLSVWRPLLFDDEYRTVYTATNSRTSPNEKVSIVTEGEDSDGTALATPVEFECVWTDSKTGGNNDGQLWRAICPANYKALSDVAIHQSNSGLKPKNHEACR